VLVVRGQTLSKTDFLAYSRRFGRLKPHRVKRTRDPEHPEITLMGVTTGNSASDKLVLDRGQGWHTDGPWDSEICKATQLYALEIPSYGGDTLFASMHAAYDALPEQLKTRIAPLKVEFGYGGRARIGIERLAPEDQEAPPTVYDMVRVHPETGRKSLYVNPTHIIRVAGMQEEEGDRLLAELYWYMLQPNAEYRHKWQAGDIVIWDNRCTVHSAAGGQPADQRRVHWRTTIMQ
jgi:taurine dioxygenase